MEGLRTPHPLRTAAIAVTALGLVAAAAPTAVAQLPGCGGAANARAVPTPASDLAILCLVNQQRAMHHIGPLRINPRLAGGARRYSRQMIARRYFSHIGPGNQSLQRRVLSTGYLRGARGYALGEALAWAGGPEATPAALVTMLMNDPPHRAILLAPSYRDVGVGVGTGVPAAGIAGATLTLDFGSVSH